MKTILAVVLVCALPHAWAGPVDIRTAMGDYLQATNQGDTGNRDSAADELYTQEVRRRLSTIQPSAGCIQATVFHKTDLLVANRRLDNQLTGDAGGGASTTLAALTGVTQVVSAALESGLVNRSTEGALSTFRLNIAGLRKLYSSAKPCSTPKNAGIDWLRGLSVAAGFERSQEVATIDAAGTVAGTNTTVPATTALPGLKGVGKLRTIDVRYEFRRRRSFEEAARDASWADAMKTLTDPANALARAVNTFIVNVQADAGEWRTESRRKLDAIAMSAGPDDVKLERMIESYTEDLENFVKNAEPRITSAAVLVATTNSAFLTARNAAFEKVLYPVAATAEYLYQRPINQTAYHSARLVIGKPFGEQSDGSGARTPVSQLTLNFAASAYDGNRPATVGILRDLRAALQLDRFLPVGIGEQKAVFSLAGYYQYQAQKGILTFDGEALTPYVGIPLTGPANVLLDTKGSIVAAQAKLTFPVGSGVDFPVAVTWSNRSELIKSNYTKLQFGFTFDVDKLIKTAAAK